MATAITGKVMKELIFSFIQTLFC